ncbi:Vegetative incompatibility protein HET-E-1 [Cladobotryum mycophilum]|uniref:Vegetative incompatibility protein HET-E-1 n=1 Tax=Cladobotryum mycophilum TaxID=491253 RepID=A0ABR0S7M9_9HYPO
MADVLGLVSNIGQIVDLFVKVGVMCSIYCMDAKNAPSDVRRILKEADKFTATLKNLERMLAGPNASKLEGSVGLRRTIDECRQLLLGLVAKLDMGARHARAVWPFKKKDVQDIVMTLERQKTTILMDLSIEQTVVLLDIHQETVLSKLRVAEAATYDSSLDGDESLCLPGTRVDIMQQIQQWCNDPASGSIFWLNGMAGTGKSTISRTVARSFAEKNTLGASFFFKRGEGDRGRVSYVFTTIVAQLVRGLPSIAPFVRDAIDGYPAIHEKSISDQFERLILDPLKKASASIQWQGPTLVVVIDALDECDREDSMRTMIRVLSQARDLSNPRLKFFLTSRPELPIRLGFEEISGQYDGLLLAQIPKLVIQHDIGAYMRHQLDAIRKDYNMSVMSTRRLSADWPGEENFEKLVAMAIPLFIVAATICRLLKDRRLGGPQNQLNGILEYQKARLSSLDATYLPVLDRLLVGLSHADRKEIIARFRYNVGSIVLLASPLSIAALARLLQVPTDVIEDQLDLLHSVLSVPFDVSTPVRLLHLSFRDFLLDPEKESNPSKYPFWVNEQATHEILLSQCLKLLSSGETLKENVCSLRLPGTPRVDVDQRVIDACLPPEVQYACLYWVHHLSSTGHTIQDNDIVHRFLNSHLLHWLEALSFLGKSGESHTILGQLVYLVKPENSPMVSSFLQDAHRFILANITILDKAPLQIYVSALVFAPQQSIIRKTFQKSIPAWIVTVPIVSLDFDPCITTFEAKSKNLTLEGLSFDGKRIASVSLKNDFKIWDAETTACLLTYQFPLRSCVGFCPDGQCFTVLSSDGALSIHDAETGNVLKGPNNLVDRFASARFSVDGRCLILILQDHTFKIWDRKTGTAIETYQVCCSDEDLIKPSPDGSMVAVIAKEGFIRVWDTKTSRLIAEFNNLQSPIGSILFSPDGSRLISYCPRAIAQLCDLFSGTHFTMPSCHGYEGFSPDGSLFITIMQDDSRMELWDAEKSSCRRILEGHTASVVAATFSPDGNRIASASADQTIRLWNTNTGSCFGILYGHSDSVTSVVFKTDSKTLVSASRDGTIKVWDTSLSTHAPRIEKHSEGVISLSFSPNGKNVVSASSDMTFRINIVIPFYTVSAPFNHIMSTRDSLGWPRSVFFSPNGSTVASICQIGDAPIYRTHHSDPPNLYLKVHDVVTGCNILSQKSFCSDIWAMAYSPDSASIAVGCDDGPITVWNVNTGHLITTYEMAGVRSIHYSPDGTLLVALSHYRSFQVWDISCGSCITMDIDDRLVASTLSHDNTKLALVANTAVTIWDINNRHCVATYKTNGLLVNGIRFSPDGSHIVVAYSSGKTNLRVLNATTGQYIAGFEVGRLINDMTFDPDGSRLYTNVGTFIIDFRSLRGRTALATTPSLDPAQLSISRQGIGISEDESWVLWNSHRVLWLPPAYRASASDVFGSRIGIGSRVGNVIWMGFEPAKIQF